MSRQERLAWFNLGVLFLTLLGFVVAIPFLGVKAATGAFGLVGLWGIGPFLYRRKDRQGNVIADERDYSIQSKAVIIGYAIFWIAFVSGNMIVWAAYREKGSIPADILPIFVLAGFAVFVLTRSIATLVQYRAGGSSGGSCGTE